MVDENKLIELAKSKPDGISNDDIKSAIPDAKIEDIAETINKFLKNGSFELYQDNGKLLYKYKDPSKKSSAKGSDSEEKIVFRIIEEAGNKGIWIRDIRFKSNLNKTQMNKVLKSLETKKYIKAVKSVSVISYNVMCKNNIHLPFDAGKQKKVYMLYDLEPDSSVTGGAWYQDQDFESEFVDVLSQQCLRFLTEKGEEAKMHGGGPLLARNKSYATANDVHKFISELGISKVRLSVSDIESILYTVVLDNNAERIVSGEGFLYRATNKFLSSVGLVKTTCGVCPIANRCADTGLINPKICEYLTDWLEEN